jgi:hypothetical protein
MAMSMKFSSVGAAPLLERGDDLYETAECAVESLLGVESLPHHIWEPACGPGAIVHVLRRHGHTVWATDLVDYQCPQSEPRVDFLMERQARIDVEAVVTNPPFKLAAEFVEHALALCPRVIMLLRLSFLESEGRTTILESGHLARVHVFRKRLPMMHRAGWSGNKVSNPTAFAWFVWDRAHNGPTELRRISWETT